MKKYLKYLTIPLLVLAGFAFSKINTSEQIVGASVVVGTQGGTALSSYTKGDILYAPATFSPASPGTASLAVLNIGNPGQCLGVSGGIPAWTTCGSGGGMANYGVREGYSGAFSKTVSLSFEGGAFNVNVNPTTKLASVSLDYTNGPASRTIAQTISGAWTFSNGATISSNFEVQGYASLSNTLFANLGNVGIGTTNPTTKLDIRGNASVSSNFETVGYASIGGNLTVVGNSIFSGGASFAKSLELTSSTGRLGINSGGATETSFELGGSASISDPTVTSGNVMTIKGPGLTSGNVLSVTSAGTVTGNIINVNGSGMTSGAGISITANALNTGQALSLNSTGSIVSPGSMLSITNNTMQSGTLASFSAQGLTSGTGIRLLTNNIDSGIGLDIRTNGLTTGNNARFVSSGTIITPGALLALKANSLTTGSVASISAMGSVTGNVIQIRTGLTTGAVASISAPSFTSGNIFNVQIPNTATGNLLNVVTLAGYNIASLSATGNAEFTGYASVSRLFDATQASISSSVDSATISRLSIGTGVAASNFFTLSGGRAMYGYDTNLANVVIGGGTGKGIAFYTNGTTNSFLSGTRILTLGAGVGLGGASLSKNIDIWTTTAAGAVASIGNSSLSTGQLLALNSTGTIITPGSALAIRVNALTTGAIASISAMGSVTGNIIQIRTAATTGAIASISALSLQGGNVFSITVPAASFTGNILQVLNSSSRTIASLSGVGNFETVGYASIGLNMSLGLLSAANTSSSLTLWGNNGNTQDQWVLQAGGVSGVDEDRFSILASNQPVFEIASNSHIISRQGTKPTISCSAGSPSVSAGSTDVAGEFVAGAAATACTITFRRPWAIKPSCQASVDGTTGLALGIQPSTTTVVFNSASIGGVNVTYLCIGYGN